MHTTKSLLIEQLDAQTFFTKIDEITAIIKEIKVQAPNNQDNSLLTRQEVADILKVSIVTVWSWTNKGILQPYRIGNKVRYKKSEILNAPVPIKYGVARK